MAQPADGEINKQPRPSRGWRPGASSHGASQRRRRPDNDRRGIPTPLGAHAFSSCFPRKEHGTRKGFPRDEMVRERGSFVAPPRYSSPFDSRYLRRATASPTRQWSARRFLCESSGSKPEKRRTLGAPLSASLALVVLARQANVVVDDVASALQRSPPRVHASPAAASSRPFCLEVVRLHRWPGASE